MHERVAREGLNRQERSVLIGRDGDSSAMAIPLWDIPANFQGSGYEEVEVYLITISGYLVNVEIYLITIC